MPVRPHARLGRAAAASFVYALALVLCFHAVLLHPGSRIIGGFSDGTSQLRDYWAASVQHRTPFTFTHDALLEAPQGTAMTPATVVANGGIQAAFMWALHRPLGLIGAWNAFMLLGFFATALAMFVFLGWLGCSVGASLLGGYVFAFCPYALERAYAGHLAFVQNWVFVLLATALLKLRDARAWRYALAAGVALALAFYQSAYTGLFAGFLTLVLVACELVGRRSWSDRLRTATLGAAVYGACLVLLTPIFALYAREHAAVVQTTTFGSFELYDYAAQLSAYLVPSPRNPLFHWLAHVHPSDLTEETLYFGYVTLALALAAIVLAVRRDRWFTADDRRRPTALAFGAVAICAFLWSLPPSYHLDGVKIPMPSSTIGLLSATYRVYSRFGILAGFALVVLAALGLSALAARRGRWRLLTPLAAIVVFLEILPGNVATLNAAAPPAWVAWLASRPKATVATYPSIFGTALGQDLWYQTLDRDPQFDTEISQRQYDPATRDEGIRLLARDLFDPLTAHVLATEGVRYVVVHDGATGYRQPPSLPHAYYTLVKRFPGVRIFSVHAARVDITRALRANIGVLNELQDLGAPTVTYGRGFNGAEEYDGGLSRWMIDNGVLRFDNAGGPIKLTLAGEAFSNQVTRVLELRGPTGRTLAHATITTDAVPLTLGPFYVPHGVSSFTLVATPGPETLGPTDPRQASVFIEPLVMYVMPSYIPGGCPTPIASGPC